MQKIKKKNLLILVLVISLILNFYLYHKHYFYINQQQSQNQTNLWAISVSGKNLAERLEEFLGYSHESDQKELFNSWRVVIGENHSIHFILAGMSPQSMDEQKSKWELLQYSLLRVDGFLNSLSNKFLEQGSYAINKEEKEQLKAVSTIYSKIYEEVKNESDKPAHVIDSLSKEMMIIDPYYSSTLEMINKKIIH